MIAANLFKNKKFQHYIDLIAVLTHKEMKVRYKSSTLGYLWSVLNPLAFALVFFCVFKVVMRIPMENYTLFLIAGLFPWQWLNNTASTSPNVFITNSTLIKKTNFPRNIILLSVVLQDMIHFILAIPVILFFMFVYHQTPSFSWTYGIPVLLFLQLLMTYGIGLFLSSINLFFRDLERMTLILMLLAFYATPIIYNEQMVPEKFKPLLYLNPFAPLIMTWRELLLSGKVEPSLFAISTAYSVAIFFIGYWTFKKLSWKFAEVL
ncbi:MAG: ABC transporter permease [Gammaproteobacteria bacterium]